MNLTRHPALQPAPQRRPRLRALCSAVAFASLLSGCSIDRHTVIASTGTTLGVELTQDQATQSPRLKVGYNRAELALVPSNRSANKDAGSGLAAAGCAPCARGESGCTTPERCKAARQNTRDGGATDTAEVLMEIRMQGGILFNGIQDAGLYQRLAVGKTAVQQPGASLMFARDKKGEISPEAAPAVRAAVQSSPAAIQTTTASILGRAELREAYLRHREAGDQAALAQFETAAQAAGRRLRPGAASGVRLNSRGLPDPVSLGCGWTRSKMPGNCSRPPRARRRTRAEAPSNEGASDWSAGAHQRLAQTPGGPPGAAGFRPARIPCGSARKKPAPGGRERGP